MPLQGSNQLGGNSFSQTMHTGNTLDGFYMPLAGDLKADCKLHIKEVPGMYRWGKQVEMK